jgi:hypothetical protein
VAGNIEKFNRIGDEKVDAVKEQQLTACNYTPFG